MFVFIFALNSTADIKWRGGSVKNVFASISLVLSAAADNR